MKCPYCDQEMKAGFLQGGIMSMLFWMPKPYYQQHAFSPSTKQKIIQEGGIVIKPGMDNFGGDVFYVCEDCGKMIAELKNRGE